MYLNSMTNRVYNLYLSELCTNVEVTKSVIVQLHRKKVTLKGKQDQFNGHVQASQIKRKLNFGNYFTKVKRVVFEALGKENTSEYQFGIILEVVLFLPDLHKHTFEYKCRQAFINVIECVSRMDFLNTLHRFIGTSLFSVFRCNVLNKGRLYGSSITLGNNLFIRILSSFTAFVGMMKKKLCSYL